MKPQARLHRQLPGQRARLGLAGAAAGAAAAAGCGGGGDFRGGKMGFSW